MSAASRPVAIRSRDDRGASRVPSTTRHCPSTNASATAWKSIGDRPGAYTATSRAGTFRARRKATDQVRVIPADALAEQVGVHRAVDRVTAAGDVTQVPADPCGDSGQQFVGVGQAAELPLGAMVASLSDSA